MSLRILFIILCFHLTSGTLLGNLQANVTVDSSGSGDFRKVQDGVNSAPITSKYRYIIHVRHGKYHENVYVPENRWNVTLVGDGEGRTIISSNKSNATGYELQKTATLGVDGQGFLVVNLTVQNSAGREGRQAVALYANSKYSAYVNVTIAGHQDTLWVNQGPQIYVGSSIRGTVDFIFGLGPAVFQNCKIYAREALIEQKNVIAASKCTPAEGDHCGFSFHLCRVLADHSLLKSKVQTPTYLGRPLRSHAITVYMESEMAEVINPEGWMDKDNLSSGKTLFFREYRNHGEGAAQDRRVPWVGKQDMEKKLAERFTVDKFIKGKDWLPALGVQFVGGLIG